MEGVTAALDGSGVNPNFITGLELGSPCELAVDAAHVCWTGSGAGGVGRANLDGSGVNQNFITSSVGLPLSVAVDSGGPPSNTTRHPNTKITKASVNPKKRKASFKFSGSGGAGHLSFKCKLDRRAFKGCRSPLDLRTFDGSRSSEGRGLDETPRLSEAAV